MSKSAMTAKYPEKNFPIYNYGEDAWKSDHIT